MLVVAVAGAAVSFPFPFPFPEEIEVSGDIDFPMVENAFESFDSDTP